MCSRFTRGATPTSFPGETPAGRPPREGYGCAALLEGEPYDCNRGDPLEQAAPHRELPVRVSEPVRRRRRADAERPARGRLVRGRELRPQGAASSRPGRRLRDRRLPEALHARGVGLVRGGAADRAAVRARLPAEPLRGGAVHRREQRPARAVRDAGGPRGGDRGCRARQRRARHDGDARGNRAALTSTGRSCG